MNQEQLNDLFGDAYSDMMVFDSIIINRDRHLGNFGMLVDNNTGEYLKPAPIFDNGYSLLLGAANYDLAEGFDEYIDSQGVCIIEWANIIEDILPDEYLKIELNYKESGREMVLTPFGQKYEEIVAFSNCKIDSELIDIALRGYQKKKSFL